MLWMAGEKRDPVTKVHHLGAIMACCAILIDAEAHDALVDDRPKSNTLTHLLKELEDIIANEERDEHGRVKEGRDV